MSLRAVLFDLGNTLLHYGMHGHWRTFLHERLEEVYSLVLDGNTAHHVAPLTFAEVAAEEIGGDRARRQEHRGVTRPFEDRLRLALVELGLTYEEAQLQYLIKAFYEPIRARTEPYADTRSALAQLHTAGYQLGIVSDTPWDTPGYLCRGDMEKWKIASYFHAMYFSGDRPWRKPHPRTLLAAADELGVKLHECVMVGDMLARDIAAAEAAGIPSIWIDRGYGVVPWEGARPTVTVKSLTEAVAAVEQLKSGTIPPVALNTTPPIPPAR